MMKLIAGLGIALLLSVSVNLFQLVSYVKHSTAEPLKQQLAVYEQTAAVNIAVAKQRAVDDIALQKAVAAATRVEIQTVTKYRDRAAALPAPVCAPGADRVATWNIFATGAPPQ